MANSIVLSLIGPDRPGLVELLAQTIAEHDGNWVDSRMSVLADRFAGVVLVSVPDEKADALRRALHALERQGLRLMVEDAAGETAQQDYRHIALELVGQDHPGIVRDVSHVLRERGVNIGDLSTEAVSGAMSGEALFKMTAEIQVPHGVSDKALRDALEALADDIMVDIELAEAEAPKAD